MTVGKSGLLSAGLVAVFALGVMTGPTIRDNWSKTTAPEVTVASPSVEPSAAAPVEAKTATPRARVSAAAAREAVATERDSNAIWNIEVSFWEPAVRDRVKAVLNPGARLELAAADFHNSEQFVTVAHAARNTAVPFMVLKDRVVNQGQSLALAIREFKPELDANAEVKRARAAARSDLGIAG